MDGGFIREKIKKWKVESYFNDKSLLHFLQKMTESRFSNHFLKKSVENGFCRLNGFYELFASKRLKIHDEVELAIDLMKETKKNPLKIIFEDEYLLVIEKNIDIVCEKEQLTKLVERQIYPVHRLDKKASGLLLLAKNRKVFEKMKSLFVKREIEKTYIALVDKPLRKKKGKIENFLRIKKEIQGQKIYSSAKIGKYALSFYKVICQTNKIAALLCNIITGRTHQLRVHLSEMGHPILGDFLYAKKFDYPYFMSRLFLHGYRMAFEHPIKKKKMEFICPLPDAFFSVLKIMPKNLMHEII